MSLYDIPNVTSIPDFLNQTNYFVCIDKLSGWGCGSYLGGFILLGIFVSFWMGQKFFYPSSKAFMNASFLIVFVAILLRGLNLVGNEAIVITTIMAVASFFFLKD